ncbi:MAG: DNA polymerase IV [Verrucomicrobiota bacterium]
MEPFLLRSFPRAIIHFDGDAFFASVEQAIDPSLKGRPVVTGKERGIIACASYEAKALGVKRGIPLFEAKKVCKNLVILPSDYETYGLYSKRMFDILRTYTPVVEEYSIDEGFADISGLRRVFHTSYEEIARQVQRDLQAQLDITVSVGLSLSKSLAKLASKFRKPRGFTAVAGNHIHLFLPKIELEKVWGFGPNTVQMLTKLGLKTACDFVLRPEKWAERLMGKVGREIWNELRGNAMYPVVTEEKSSYCTISKSRTFTPPSRAREFVYAKLVRNLESAFIKLRRHRLRARVIGLALRHQDFSEEAVEAALNRPTSSTQEAVPLAKELFDHAFREGVEYRATMVVLGKLEADREEQFDLFEDRVRIDKLSQASRAIDAVNEQFGKHTLSLGPSLYLQGRKGTDRDDIPWRKKNLLPTETRRQRLNIPRLSIKV